MVFLPLGLNPFKPIPILTTPSPPIFDLMGPIHTSKVTPTSHTKLEFLKLGLLLMSWPFVVHVSGIPVHTLKSKTLKLLTSAPPIGRLISLLITEILP